MIKNITLKLNTSFFQFAFTVLAVLCTLQMHGHFDLGLNLGKFPLTWLTWTDGIWDLVKVAFCAWVVLPLICGLILLLITMLVIFLVAVIFKVLFKGAVKW